MVIGFITLLVYLPALSNSFVWDDVYYVTENPPIRSLDSNFFKWAFFDFHAANWHPLTWISHAIDFALWELTPRGHHLTNIILHALCTVLVFLVAVKLFCVYALRMKEHGQSEIIDSKSALTVAGITALLFGLHPLHVESAAWVAERKDLLCAVFYLLSVYSYLDLAGAREIQKGQRVKFFFQAVYLRTFVFFALALLSKPMAVTLPLVLLILDWHPARRIYSTKTFWSACAEKLPFFILSGLSTIITMEAQKAGGALQTSEFAPLAMRLLVAAKAVIAYAVKMIWPFNLIPFYPYPRAISAVSALEYAAAIAGIIGITLLCIVAAKKVSSRFLLAAWAYYIVTLIPVLGIVQVGEQAMADRYTYLPSFGPFFIIGMVSWRISERVSRNWSRAGTGQAAAAICALTIFICLAVLTIRQIGVWKDSISLWNYVIEKEPEKVPLAYYNRGTVYGSEGLYDKAIEDLNMAIALRPDYYEAYSNRGIVYTKIGLMDRAMESLNSAVSLYPESAEARTNRGLVFFMTGNRERALEDYNAAIAADKNYALAYYNRGKLYAHAGRNKDAVSDFLKSCELGYENGCKSIGQLLDGRTAEH